MKYRLLFLIILSLIVRAINLNYNSFLNDEAIYVVVGKLGLFNGDWSSYHANAWMAGSPYLFPSLTAVAYTLGGIAGSRLLNVFFGVLSVILVYYWTVNLAQIFKFKRKYLAGILSAILISFSSVSLYVSRLATYDMPSFFFLILGLFLLTKIEAGKNTDSAKLYFYAALSLIISFLTKVIVGIYVPVVFIASFWLARKQSQKRFSSWKTYFVLPLVVFLTIFMFAGFADLFGYLKSQTTRENMAYLVLAKEVVNQMKFVSPFWLIGSIGFFFRKKFLSWMYLNFGAFLIVVIHFLTKRLSTLDKHLYLTVLFSAMIFGLGVVQLPKKVVSWLWVPLLMFTVFSYRDIQKYNNVWGNTDMVSAYLRSAVKSNDKVLAEEGPQVILSVFDADRPENISTFDWFEYQGRDRVEAYKKSVTDGYFNFIQIDTGSRPKTSVYSEVYKEVWGNLPDRYQLVFKQGEYSVFKRK